MSLLQAHRRARQQRALATLDTILTEDGGIRLEPLRWVVEPDSTLTGQVPPRGDQEDIRDQFEAWTELLGARRLAEFGDGDHTVLRAVFPQFGIYRVHVTITATIPVPLRPQASLLVTRGSERGILGGSRAEDPTSRPGRSPTRAPSSPPMAVSRL